MWRRLKTGEIELFDGTCVPILYEDRSVLAIDKPAGWLLVPETWKNTSRNLQRELMLSLGAGEYWARSRNLKYIRFIHRLDAETSGVLLLAKSAGALSALSQLFETRLVGKKYLAVVDGIPKETTWECRLRISQEPGAKGQMRVDQRNGKDAQTAFRVLERRNGTALIQAVPATGRTHQIRVHLAASGHPVLGDSLYGGPGGEFALRAVELSYTDPFLKRPVRVTARTDEFLRRFHFGP
jgi:23S rRNA pseudouridine1911/1915/1917 synthase